MDDQGERIGRPTAHGWTESDFEGAGYLLRIVPGLGPLFGLLGIVFLPGWCAESLKRDASRTGRSVGPVTRWAFLWPLATVAVLGVLAGIAIAAGLLGLFIGWLFIPLGTGSSSRFVRAASAASASGRSGCWPEPFSSVRLRGSPR